MASHLLSIIGRPNLNDGGIDGGRYLQTTYRFRQENRTVDIPGRLFGACILKWFAHLDQPIHRTLWLGTTQSAWACLLEEMPADSSAHGETWLELWGELLDFEKADPPADPATLQAALDRLGRFLTAHSGNHQECRLIPQGKEPLEQNEMARACTDALKKGDSLILDLTHGLRIHSLLLAQRALAMEAAFGVKVKAQFYGGFDLKDNLGIAPAVDLTGLLEEARLTGALDAFRKGGDLRILEDHLPDGNLKRHLMDMGHAIATHNYFSVQDLANQASSELAQPGIRDSLGLLSTPISQAISQARDQYLPNSQMQIAEGHLARRDYLRATLAAYEAVLTKACESSGSDKRAYKDREDAKALVPRTPQWTDLSHLRNHLAHGTGSNRDIQRIAADPNRLRDTLRNCFQWARTYIE